jgi:multicomponent Na+:H+ antiporter subunit E
VTSAARSGVALFLLLCGVWLLCSGPYSLDGHHTLIPLFGLGSCAGVTWLALRMGIVDAEAVPVHLIGRALRYLPWIATEVLKANLDVAGRVLRPGLPVAPEILRVKPSQRTDLGRVLYANSITLTPGTVTIEAEGDHLLVHAIARAAAAGLECGIMDAKVSELEGPG